MRRRLRTALRVAFLAVVIGFIWWGLRGQGDEIVAALRATTAAELVAGFALVCIGLLVTGFIWLRVMATLGHRLPVRAGLRIFFLGQLGKYIPGSVWSFGAQAALAKDLKVPQRMTVAGSLVFLGFSVATASLGGAVLVGVGAVDASFDGALSGWLAWAVAGAALVGMHPRTVGWLTGLVAGVPYRLPWRDWGVIQALFWATWSVYALSTRAVVPGSLAVLSTAMLLAYAGGVLVVLAPAGVGAREAVFIAVAAPIIGVGPAAAGALVTRLLYLGGDVVLALATGFHGRPERPAS